jgi:hypothetical protein
LGSVLVDAVAGVVTIAGVVAAGADSGCRGRVAAAFVFDGFALAFVAFGGCGLAALGARALTVFGVRAGVALGAAAAVVFGPGAVMAFGPPGTLFMVVLGPCTFGPPPRPCPVAVAFTANAMITAQIR